MAGNEILAIGDEQIAELEEKQANKVEEPVVVETSDNPVTTTTEGDVAAVEDKEPDVVAEEEHSTYWGDVPVDISVPDEISSLLKEHKIDEAKLISELFSKDGKFELSAETRKPLEKAFGKHIVDGYLNLYKSQNQMFMDKHSSDQAEQQKQVEANTTDFQELVGGDDGWTELANWAGETMSGPELAQFNAVMTLPAEHYQAQRAVVEALQIKRLAGLGDKHGDQQVKLLTDTGGNSKSPTDTLPASLTREEFQQLHGSDKYLKDPQWAARVDAIRRRSQATEKAQRRT